VVPAPPFEICDPLFHVCPLVAAYIQYSIKNVAPPSGFWPLLLLNRGDGPSANKILYLVSFFVNHDILFFLQIKSIRVWY